MRRTIQAAILTAGAVLMSSGAIAQSGGPASVEGRVDRLEREMRAVQRKVFPGGAGQTLAPEITPPEQAQPAPGVPATSPIADVTARLNALEGELTSLTAQVEQNQHRTQLAETALQDYKRATEARLQALESAAAAGKAASAAAEPDTRVGAAEPAATAKAPPPGAAQPAPARPAADPARARRVAAIARPDSGDAADDAYVYGYRLWQAKLYPEAEDQLMQVVAKYPRHRRASWAQNLLGRAYLDEGRPSLATHVFYDNYKNFRDGERTADSLFYLAAALKKLGKPSKDLCQVYDTIEGEGFTRRLSPGLAAEMARARVAEKCTAR